jgi:hypothetical protein
LRISLQEEEARQAAAAAAASANATATNEERVPATTVRNYTRMSIDFYINSVNNIDLLII